MLNRIRYRVNSVRQISKTDGLAPLFRRFGRYIKWKCFVYYTSDLYEFTQEDFRSLNEADFKPKINNFTLKIVFSNEEANKLEAEGFEFRSQDINSRYYLDNGVVAFCIFVENELANLGWVEITQQLSECNIVKVDYSNNEVHGGFGWTNPKYRRLGLQRYGTFKRRQFVFEKGKTVVRSSVLKSNIANQTANTTFHRKYGEVRYFKILGWESIKTTYVDGYKPPSSS